MGISGWLEAKCKECKCRFSWYIDSNWPFVDSEIIGTCDKCLNKLSHDCIDELTINNNVPINVGRKEFQEIKKKV